MYKDIVIFGLALRHTDPAQGMGPFIGGKASAWLNGAMISWKTMPWRRGLFLFAAGAAFAPAMASAQTQDAPGSYTYQLGSAQPDDPSVDLSRYVRDLLTNPQSLVALKGAGQAALKLGDAEAAGGFFARADDVSPRDGEVKAGLAASFALMGQADNALRLFQEAANLGVPDRDVAAYRGLAYDLKGNQAAAQQDYALALRAHPGAAEVERRLALSLAISGQKDRAIQTIDAQLRKQDRAAWRTRAFILALTGDTAGARQAVEAVLPAQAGAFAPFLARLGSLTPGEKAAAVNLGQMPTTFQNLRTAENIADTAPAPASPLAPVAAKPKPVAIARVEKPAARTVQASPVQPVPAKPAEEAPPVRFADVAALIRDLSESPAAPAPATSAPKAPAKPASAEKDVKAAKADAAKDSKAVAAKKSAASKVEPKKKDPKVEHPARTWVQLASGSNVSALPGEYKKIKAKAGKALAAQAAWTVKSGATNRLLVGPFKTGKEAQALVSGLAKEKVSSFAWTSTAGQEIEKLPAK